MKNSRVLAAAGLFTLLTTGALQAQGFKVEIAPFAGGTFFLGDPPDRFAIDRGEAADLIVEGGEFDTGFTLGLTAGLLFGDHWGVEGMASWIPTRLEARSGLGGTMDVNGYMYAANVVYRFTPLGMRDIEPFLGLGVGGETFDYDREGLETHTGWMANVVAGVLIPFSERVALRLEARDCFSPFESHIDNVDDAWENDLMLNAGLSLRLPSR